MISLKSIENVEQADTLESSNIIEYSEDDYSEEHTSDEEPQSDLFSIDRRRKILILQFYLNEFSNKLGVYSDMDFETLSNEELDKIRDEFDFIIGTKNTVNISVRAFQHSIKMLEDFCISYTPLKVKGLSNINTDPELLDDVKHFALQNMALIKTKPEHRILFKVISTMSVLHSHNSLYDNQETNQVRENNIENNNSVNMSRYDDL